MPNFGTHYYDDAGYQTGYPANDDTPYYATNYEDELDDMIDYEGLDDGTRLDDRIGLPTGADDILSGPYGRVDDSENDILSELLGDDLINELFGGDDSSPTPYPSAAPSRAPTRSRLPSELWGGSHGDPSEWLADSNRDNSSRPSLIAAAVSVSVFFLLAALYCTWTRRGLSDGRPFKRLQIRSSSNRFVALAADEESAFRPSFGERSGHPSSGSGVELRVLDVSVEEESRLLDFEPRQVEL